MKPTIIVPVRVLKGEGIERGVVELLANARVVLVGYHVLPEQTAPGQARTQFEDRAQTRLSELAKQFKEVGATVDKRLVFTQNFDQSINRITEEVDADGTLVLNPATEMEDVLVAVRSDEHLDRIVAVTGELLDDTNTSITLLHVSRPESEFDGRALLDQSADALGEYDIEEARIDTRIETAGKPLERIATIAADYDAVVVGESDPSVGTFLFGQTSDQVAERFMGPVLRVRQPRETDDVRTDIAEAAKGSDP